MFGYEPSYIDRKRSYYTGININEQVIVAIGERISKTGERKGVEFADIGFDGKPIKGPNSFGGLPSTLTNVQSGDRVITVGLSPCIDAPLYGVEFGENAWILGKKVPFKT